MYNRYKRQIKLIGAENQKKLAKASVLIVGAGGIGSPLSLYLAGAGIGKISLIDFDRIELSNLHRQILFNECDLNKPKASTALTKLAVLNSNILIDCFDKKLTPTNAVDFIQNYNLIIDGSDNFQTKYLINDVCCQLGIPFISASIYRNELQLLHVDHSKGCFRCIFPEPPPPTLISNCIDSGVLGSTAGIAGSMACSLAINALLKENYSLSNKLIHFNGNTFKLTQCAIQKQKHCPACELKQLTWPSINHDLYLDEIELNHYLIIDVRENGEDRSSTLSEKDLHLPFSSFLKEELSLPCENILLYCKTGTRSNYASHILRKKGYPAFSLFGGIEYNHLEE